MENKREENWKSDVDMHEYAYTTTTTTTWW